MLTDDDIAQMEARCAAATEGPWTVEEAWKGAWRVRLAPLRVANMEAYEGDPDVPTEAQDATFIAHARTDMEALLKERRQMLIEHERLVHDYGNAMALLKEIRENDQEQELNESAQTILRLCRVLDQAKAEYRRALALVEGLAKLWVQDATAVTEEAWRFALFAPYGVDVDVEELRNNARALLSAQAPTPAPPPASDSSDRS